MSNSTERRKTKRKIIKIDKELCTGCGKCVIGCDEGALEIIDGKAEVVNESFCDGLGACIGECPEGALSIEEREAYEFDETLVEQHQGEIQKNVQNNTFESLNCSCSSAETILYEKPWKEESISENIKSALRQWPIKLRLVNPDAPYFDHNELLIVSDCSPLAYGDFHRRFLKGRPIISLCPMLNVGEPELQKLELILQKNPISSLEIVLMDVPCCKKLHILLNPILDELKKDIKVQVTIISREGEIKN
ncbi:MAG: 4Fe-4S dicluster domain-containing protein [Promethearchaeota archaeon]|nr:MAG: 4Fe-4S dicluster domain-containing protein [Candidatus Lokiarchaeota archaeon]